MVSRERIWYFKECSQYWQSTVLNLCETTLLQGSAMDVPFLALRMVEIHKFFPFFYVRLMDLDVEENFLAIQQFLCLCCQICIATCVYKHVHA